MVVSLLVVLYCKLLTDKKGESMKSLSDGRLILGVKNQLNIFMKE